MTENNGSAKLGDDWVIVLLGARTLLGQKNRTREGFPTRELSPVYQLEVRAQPQQGIDPNTRQPVMVMTRARFVSPVSEIDGWDSLELPDAGIVVKSLNEFPPAFQNEMAQGVANYENAKSAAKRKLLIEEQAASAAKTSFGGGARKE